MEHAELVHHIDGHNYVVLIARELLSSGRGLEGVGRRQLSRSAEAVLVSHDWPGNVRELENALFRAALRSRGSRIVAADLVGSAPELELKEAEPLSVQVLRLVDERGVASVGNLVEELGRPRSTVKRLVKGLAVAGDLVAIGAGRSTRYRRPSVVDAHLLDARERIAVALVERDGRVTRKSLAEASEMATRTSGRVLAGLVEAGVLMPDGRLGKSSGYVLASDEASPVRTM